MTEGLSAETKTDSEFRFERVSHYFLTSENSSFHALHDINISFSRGEFVCVIGPSGCGKSTLLNLIAGVLFPTKGEVLFREAPLREINKSVGYLTQNDHLLPWRTVERNVGMALEIRGVDRTERNKRVAEALARVGLESFAKQYPSKLSGGMRKRVALARTLIYEPETLLMDEPFAALDAQLRKIMQEQLLRLWGKSRKTVIFITHDLEEAILLADRIVVFGTKPGRIIHVEPIRFKRPRLLTELRKTEEFAGLWDRLWSLIEPQLSIFAREG